MNGNAFRTPLGSTILLCAATVLGLVVAVLTRSGALPKDTWVCKPVMCLFHFGILGIWSTAWLGFWKHVLKARGGWRLAAGIAILAAVTAELIQIWWPGHICDALGMGCNLVGAILAILGARWLWRERSTSGE
jgi:hypothetical protein